MVQHRKNQTLTCALEVIIENVLRQKDCWAQIHNMLIDKDPLGQVIFFLFNVTMFNLHEIMMKPEIKLISTARLYWSLYVF